MTSATTTSSGEAVHFHPSELALFHKNPRIGNVDVIAASLRANTQYKPIVVNVGTHTGRPNEVLAGNHTLKAFRDLAEKYPDEEQWQSVATWTIDVDDDRAARIVLADNRTAEVGSMDDDQLLDLLDGLEGLDGTGYDEDYLEMLEQIAGGPPDLDDLEREAGDPTEEDESTIVRLLIDPDVARVWGTHRDRFQSDTAALSDLLSDQIEEDGR